MRSGKKRACLRSGTQFRFALTPIAFVKCVNVSEYDGREPPIFLKGKCLLDRIRDILNTKGIITKDEFKKLAIRAKAAKDLFSLMYCC